MRLTTTMKTLCVTVLAAAVVGGIAGCGREEPPEEPTPRERPAQPMPPERQPQDNSTEEPPRHAPPRDLGE